MLGSFLEEDRDPEFDRFCAYLEKSPEGYRYDLLSILQSQYCFSCGTQTKKDDCCCCGYKEGAEVLFIAVCPSCHGSGGLSSCTVGLDAAAMLKQWQENAKNRCSTCGGKGTVKAMVVTDVPDAELRVPIPQEFNRAK